MSKPSSWYLNRTRRGAEKLKRLTGGYGHLSNRQAAETIAQVNPKQVVLLHLSKRTNRPDLALEAVYRAGYKGKVWLPGDFATMTEPLEV